MLIAELAADIDIKKMERQHLPPLLKERLAARLGLSLAKGADRLEWMALSKTKYHMYTPNAQFNSRPARERRRDTWEAEQEMDAEQQMHAILGWLAPDAETLPSTWLELDMSF